MLLLCLHLSAAGQSKTVVKEQITGIFWQVVSFEDTIPSRASGQKMGITLMNNNKMSGFALCNNISGTYSLKPARGILHFKNMNMTWRGCAGAVRAEYHFLNALKITTHYRLSKDTLVLYAGNRRMMSLLKQQGQ
ncbi:META domain-containing protein [Pedobacter steynii]|nr:META domain-containing protein [Pedobacter steynii]